MRKRVRGGERDCGSLLDSKVTSNLAFSFFDLDLLLFPSYFSFLFFETALSLYLHNDVRKTEKKQRTTIVLSTGKKQGGPKSNGGRDLRFFILSLSLCLCLCHSLPLSLLSRSLPLFSPSLFSLSLPSQHSGLKKCAHLPGPLHSENSIPSALGSHAAISPLALAQSPEA